MVKKFNEFIEYYLKEGYLRRIISSEINKEERMEDVIRKQTKKICDWLDEMGVDNYKIIHITRDVYNIDVNGDVDLSGKKENDVIIPKIKGGKLPDYIKFGKVNGIFNCSFNELSSLEGCPKEVGGDFYCVYNKLSSLEGCPKKVGGDFIPTQETKITSLKGCPKEVGGIFFCDEDKIDSIETGYKDKVKIGNCFVLSNSEKYDKIKEKKYKFSKEEIMDKFDVVVDMIKFW